MQVRANRHNFHKILSSIESPISVLELYRFLNIQICHRAHTFECLVKFAFLEFSDYYKYAVIKILKYYKAFGLLTSTSVRETRCLIAE